MRNLGDGYRLLGISVVGLITALALVNNFLPIHQYYDSEIGEQVIVEISLSRVFQLFIGGESLIILSTYLMLLVLTVFIVKCLFTKKFSPLAYDRLIFFLI